MGNLAFAEDLVDEINASEPDPEQDEDDNGGAVPDEIPHGIDPEEIPHG